MCNVTYYLDMKYYIEVLLLIYIEHKLDTGKETVIVIVYD